MWQGLKKNLKNSSAKKALLEKQIFITHQFLEIGLTHKLIILTLLGECEVTWGDSPRVSVEHKFKYISEHWNAKVTQGEFTP